MQASDGTTKYMTYFLDTRKVKVLSLPETIKQNSTFRAKALDRELAGGSGKNHVCFSTS